MGVDDAVLVVMWQGPRATKQTPLLLGFGALPVLCIFELWGCSGV